ncbi:MAG: beta-galactosidase trimerization domain-containing protein [Planctomycetes bacterium]|nr:beta-galactosidase trimerization domain-containing protein [Planctomycetota bacterium]
MRIHTWMTIARSATVVLIVTACGVFAQDDSSKQDDASKAAQLFRKAHRSVTPVSDSVLVAEAEEFQVQQPGWKALPFGTNYYAATFANSFLSRRGYLGALEQVEKPVSASLEVQVPKAGKYLALVRYEAAYRFETQFRLVIGQNGKKLLDRLYGSRNNLRIWAFREKLKKEVAWPWGADENLVWEGHDAFVELAEGKAKLTLIADEQPEPAARRNVDLVMLTSDLKQVENRIEKENYLPLDGMLTQAGDLYLKVHNRADGSELKLTIPNGTEHSPYWVHMRDWKPKVVAAKPGETSDWIEVGSLLDTLSDGQWNLSAAGKGLHFGLEFAVKGADGKMEPIRKFEDLQGNVTLAYDANTRYTRRIRLADEVLYELVAYLKKWPVEGTAPKRTLIYGFTFAPKPDDAKYTAALQEFLKLMGATALGKDAPEELTSDGLVRGYIDVRDVPTDKLADYCKKLQDAKKADKIAVASLGDEIGLAQPPANDHKAFRAWLQGKGLKPSDVDPEAGTDWDKIQLNSKPETAKTNPELYYFSKIYGYRFGIKNLKDRTDILKKHLPSAGIGANFSPHHASMYLGDTHQWMSLFREDGMTMPWGEDYIWQVPVGSQQMNFIMLDMFRAAVRSKPGARIQYYVMPHTPGNTPDNWRRQFYGDIAHGAKILNLFEFRPVQAAYTENHVSDPAMYQEVRKAIHELGRFENIVQDGQVMRAQTGLWFSEAADVWHNHRPPFDVAKRCLYIAIRQNQVPLDMVLDGDDLRDYKVLYLCDANVSRAGSAAIVEWVKAGGKLFASAGAGMFDEFNRPNKVLREMLGVDQKALEESKELIRFEKQDLPFAEALDTVTWDSAVPGLGKTTLPIFGVRSVIAAAPGTKVAGAFQDGSPAITYREVGKGSARYCAFLPGLTFFHPALPKRPVDRGAHAGTYAHFLPTKFGNAAGQLIHEPTRDLVLTVRSGARLIENTVIQAKDGFVIPLINWGPAPVETRLTIRLPGVGKSEVRLASGRKAKTEQTGELLTVTLQLDVADALILR